VAAAKITITLPEQQLRAVRAGCADSVSGYIARVLTEHERNESLNALVREMIAEQSKPTREDEAWARRVVARRRRA
jgi:hypothetical protein